jgi:hypothetical protein
MEIQTERIMELSSLSRSRVGLERVTPEGEECRERAGMIREASWRRTDAYVWSAG